MDAVGRISIQQADDDDGKYGCYNVISTFEILNLYEF